jgi:hypothetical protein
LTYLGHEISGDGVRTDPKNIQAVRLWPTPSNLKEVRGFLGLAGYYRKFVRDFGIINRPLTDLLKKSSVFRWTELENASFTALKHALISAPVLALPDFSLTFEIETDASDRGIGAVLLQQKHPLAFLSKTLGPRTSMLSTYEKEALAILLAVDHWRAYLQPAEFIIHTDQKSLIHLEDQRISTPWQQKVMVKLLGLRYRVVYKRGPDNRAADALSRCPQAVMGELAAISVCLPTWLQEIQQGYHGDPQTQKLLAQLTAEPPEGPAEFSLEDGVLKLHERIWVGRNPALQQKILAAMHTGAIRGHSGVSVTYRRVRALFAWPGMKAQVRQFIETCSICKQAKPERVRYPGLLEPLPVPPHPWNTVTMDFVEGLPRSSGYNCILVVVDKLSRYAHFIPLSHPFTALQVAQAYMLPVYKLHGLPAAIVSDRDKVFTSNLWRDLFRLSQTQLRMSSSYHPQTDGQTERVN